MKEAKEAEIEESKKHLGEMREIYEKFIGTLGLLEEMRNKTEVPATVQATPTTETEPAPTHPTAAHIPSDAKITSQAAPPSSPRNQSLITAERQAQSKAIQLLVDVTADSVIIAQSYSNAELADKAN